SRDRTRLRRLSPRNGNIRGRGRRLSAISTSSSPKRGSRDESERAKSRDFRAILASLRELGQTDECVAGAGGIEPPNGGIKIRCLTAWLRPNGPFGNGAANAASRTPFGQAGL